MIQVIVRKRSDLFVSFQVEGHAYFDEMGRDIVCSAVSILAQTTLMALNKVAGVQDMGFAMEDGLLEGVLPEEMTQNEIHDTDVIFRTFIIGIEGICEAYPDFVQLMIEEVDSDEFQV